MQYRILSLLGLLLLIPSGIASAQAAPTASRAADLQAGGSFSMANSDYVPNRIRGFGFYGSIDFREHFGIEADFHQLNDPRPTQVYERTYEIGGRYVRHYGPLNPFVRAMYGRGVFNFPQSAGNLAYNMFVGAGGVDVHVQRRINVRAEVEVQEWLSGPALTNGLKPVLFTVGAAYHFGPGRLGLGY